jgi:hypothetical protein
MIEGDNEGLLVHYKFQGAQFHVKMFENAAAELIVGTSVSSLLFQAA